KDGNPTPEGASVALVFGQMNEPPGGRARVALSGLTQAEYFRDVEGQDVLFFVDNIFRFTQAGSEVSALLGRIPSAVGYQPTLATDMGTLQERITSTNKGSITSVQAIYVPADDLTDPSPARARSSASFHSPSTSLRCSRAFRASSSRSKIPCAHSRRWSAANMTTSPKPLSTWSAGSRKRSPRPRSWLRRRNEWPPSFA